MPRNKVLALVLAGGQGNRMGILTETRAKPSLPFGGVYRLIDFPLSNCVHSDISDVWIIEQFQPHALNDHLANGRPWDLDRTYGGLRILQPYTGTSESGWHEGNADAIYSYKQAIAAFAPDIILVLSADHIYKLDYRQVIDAHLEHDADVTMVTSTVPLEEAGRFGTVDVDKQGRVTRFEYKPDHPRSPIVTTEIFVYNAHRLLEILEELANQNGGDDSSLTDFGDQLLPRFVDLGRAFAFPLDGYWQDVGVIDSYWQAHMDLLASEPVLNLDEAGWPILTYGNQRMPARILPGARIENSLIAPGCEVRGTVIESVLAPGVVVAEGAIVWRSVVLHDSTIERDAIVGAAIVDTNCRIGKAAQVGSSQGDMQAIAVVGTETQVEPGARVAPGEQRKANQE